MKTKSYLLLFILILILIFILGVRYGQRVEQTNKVINYLISITPPTTPMPPLEFKKYTNKLCGVEFTYPSTAEIKSESSRSALLVDKDGQLAIDCNVNNEMLTILSDNKAATAEVNFKNRKVKAKTTNQDQTLIFSFFNPQNGKTVYAAIQKRLYPLFESSLQFITP